MVFIYRIGIIWVDLFKGLTMKKTIRFIYNLIPLKKYIFLFFRSFCIFKQNLYQHLTFKGFFRVALDNSDFKIYNTGTLIENQLFWRGIDGFEPNSLKIWIKLCRISDVIFDIGANTGVYSLIAKSENPTSTVYAFEPVERVFTILSKNFSINRFDVKYYMKAVSDKDGVGMFYDNDKEHTLSVVLNLYRSDEQGLHKVHIETIKLDSFIEHHNIQNIDLLKIDVETHEPEVFNGFKKHLKIYKPTMIIEIIRDYVASSLSEQLSGLGYNYFYINEPFGGADILVDGDSYQKVDSLVNCRHGNYLICSDRIRIALDL